mmetsp:Transcript_24076/g.37379  ORF Transcript_24076/g.37379 Transcript_24076/m.37379 type:complete len:137 (+) Transcript_24076:221-631(+)
MLANITAFIFKWSIGVPIMTCDIIYDVTVSILVLLETIVIELFSVMCVLVIDVWKTDEILEPNSTPRDNSCADDEIKGDDNTASSTESINTNRTSESGSGSDDLRLSYRHLKQEYIKKERESRTNPTEIVGSQVIF